MLMLMGACAEMCMCLILTLGVAGQSFASSDPDGGACRGRNPGNSL